MVRVISVHHFASQHIQTVEQPTASAVAPPHRLLLALSSHCIEVRDLKDHAEVLFSFPTVDEVTQIIHCMNGDYIATVETKYNRQNRETNFVRVYVNWDSVATMQQSKMTSSGVSLGSSECGMVQPMRARIAGRVTPTTNQSELGSLEMIEIPVKRNPHRIGCCQVSGNIIIQSNRTIAIYTFEVKVHDISKLRFIDFEEMALAVELSFLPSEIAACENYIACSNHDTLHLFKIVSGPVTGDNDCGEYGFNYHYEDGTIDYRKLRRNEALNVVGGEKITVHLPTVVKENSMIHKHCPFMSSDREIKAHVRFAPGTEGRALKCELQDLVRLKLKPIVIESAQKQVTEEFKCLLLKPWYVDRNSKRKSTDDGNRILRSGSRHALHSVSCMVTTQQEGYLYQFYDADISRTVDNCISVYPFTAPVYKIVMEDYFLHALTETGLESYTLRTGHELCKNLELVDDYNVACPPVNESVCLVGLRPFLGIEEVLLSDAHLVLLANADGSPTHSVSSSGSSTASYWTLYSLELPSPKTVFHDVSTVANAHRFTSTQTYCHLMHEAHMVLRVSLVLSKWGVADGNVTLIAPRKGDDEDLVETYRASCALLGDHYIMCGNEEDYSLCVPYYKMALVHPAEVLKRVRRVQEQSNNHSTRGILYYLRSVLLERKRAEKFSCSGSQQGFTEAVVELFRAHSFEDLPNLVLKSNVLREYSTDKLINILSNGSCSSPAKRNNKLLALVILHLQRCNAKRAQDLLVDIGKEDLAEILLDNWELLFETTACSGKNRSSTTFSELAILLTTTRADVLSEALVALALERKLVTLNKLLKVFLEYLPASIGSDATTGSHVLQTTLELYFRSFFAKHENAEPPFDRATHEALKLLVRSYLSQLQILQVKEKCGAACKPPPPPPPSSSGSDDEPYFENNNNKRNQGGTDLFAGHRFEYLDRMPPFQVEIEGCTPFGGNTEADGVLKKLQALLCCPFVPKQVVAEVNAFLALNENLRGGVSLKSINTGVNEGVAMLIDTCPQCLLQFGKDRFTKNDEWKLLIATVQGRIIRLSQDAALKHVCFFYKKILKDVLAHVSTSMNLEQLLEVFPQKMNVSGTFEGAELDEDPSPKKSPENDDILNEIQNYEPYVAMCKETMHANQIKKLITATGQQLLCTLNL